MIQKAGITASVSVGLMCLLYAWRAYRFTDEPETVTQLLLLVAIATGCFLITAICALSLQVSRAKRGETTSEQPTWSAAESP